ncbi:hypothetical protein AC579_497 [Pseudocercospora musae]|uniref:Uncharacterized protein n=1 Tax=Pseudocercospora musae TaxID=113226 RepID=A0A139IN81_9PEZI|nr:hypothetical protein AC579_497 [Pseudocercospora musae]
METLQSAQQITICDCVRYKEAPPLPKSHKARVSVEYEPPGQTYPITSSQVSDPDIANGKQRNASVLGNKGHE